MKNRIASFYDDTPLTDFFADAEYEVHGSAFSEPPLDGYTCDACEGVVPWGWTCCPSCGKGHDLPGLDVDMEARHGSSHGASGRLSFCDGLLLLACLVASGASVRFWLVGFQVELFKVVEWWNG